MVWVTEFSGIPEIIVNQRIFAGTGWHAIALKGLFAR
jgi:hypothetical protein